MTEPVKVIDDMMRLVIQVGIFKTGCDFVVLAEMMEVETNGRGKVAVRVCEGSQQNRPAEETAPGDTRRNTRGTTGERQ
jgi:hypothetical protein